MRKILTATLLLLLFTSSYEAVAQLPFANEIAAFKKEDSISFPPKNAILFTGSSSFRMWTDVQSDFPGYTIINRGFGGSTLPDVIRYANDIIIPYRPKQVVIYCGDNDLASSDTVTAKVVARRFQKLFYTIRKELPNANISYVSIKPSPSRMHLMDKMRQANTLIKRFLKKQKNASFIDVFTPMLGTAHQPKQDIFLEDNLHMNKKGYAIWQKAIQPYLIK
jgi:lysophospholipase L1-like esterase